MKKLVIFVFFAFVFQMGLAAAVSTPQEQITVTVEAGRSYTFELVIQNTESSTEEIVLETDGRAGKWIKFGGDKESFYSLSIPPISTVFLSVAITAPIDTDTMEYQGFINFGDSTLVNLNVRVTPPLEDIRDLEGITSLDSQFDQLKQDIINTSTDIVNELISVNQNLENKISELEDEVRSSTSQSQEGERQLQERIDTIGGLTGSIAFGTSMVGFVVGVVLSFIGIYLYANRKNLKFSKKKKKEGFEFTPSKD